MLDALVAVAVPLGVLVVAALAVWGTSGGGGVPWTVAARAGVDAWLVGHGVDLTVHLPGTAPFPLGLAALGGALVTGVLGFRAGARALGTGTPRLALGLGVLTTAVLGGLAGAAGAAPAVVPSVPQSAVLPALIFGAGMLGAAVRARRAAVPHVAARGAALRAGLAAGGAAVVALLGASALAVGLSLLLSGATVVGLTETLQAGAGGGLALLVAQLMLLPTLIVWAAAWFVGPGFALGAGSSVTPLGAVLGPVPALPVLGALPSGGGPLGPAALLVPLLAGFACAHVAAGRAPERLRGGAVLAASAVAAGTGALLLGVLAAAAAGAAGPGRLAVVGPEALPVAACAAGELFVATLLGFATARRRDAAGTDEAASAEEVDVESPQVAPSPERSAEHTP